MGNQIVSLFNDQVDDVTSLNLPNVIGPDGVLRSPHDGTWQPTLPHKSFLHHVIENTHERLRDSDWVWLRNVINGEELRASEALEYTKRL